MSNEDPIEIEFVEDTIHVPAGASHAYISFTETADGIVILMTHVDQFTSPSLEKTIHEMAMLFKIKAAERKAQHERNEIERIERESRSQGDAN